MNWPEQKVVVRLTAKRATSIRQAFKSAIDGDAIVQAWTETHPAGGSVSPQTARDWTLAHAVVNEKPLQYALSRIYADGYTLGAKVATTRLTGLKKDATVGIVDWSTWKPGNESAAALVKPRGGLKQLLNSRRIIVANEITRTKLDRIGTALARSLSKGETSKETAKAINAIIADPQHALVIAQTEMSRAMSVASRDEYEKANIEQVEWLVAEGCEDCQDNADASPIGIDDTFPSGDTEPPAHPNCMCALAPYYDPDAPDVPDVDLPDFADEAQALAEEMIEEAMPEEVFAEEPREIDLSLNEPKYGMSSLDDKAVYNKIFDEVGIKGKDLSKVEGMVNDPYAEVISRIQGFNALPKIVESSRFDDLVAKEGWTPMYRGVGAKTQAEVDSFVNQFKSGSTQFGGRGVYGSGTYAAQNRGVAEHFSKANGAKNGELHAFGHVMDMAIHPNAKILDLSAVALRTSDASERMTDVARQMWNKANKKALDAVAKKEGLTVQEDGYGNYELNVAKYEVRNVDEYDNSRLDYDKTDFDSIARVRKEVEKLTDEYLSNTDWESLSYVSRTVLDENVGNRAALAGVDVIRVPKPEYSRDESGNLSDYYIILNRGAVAVRK